MTWYKWKWWRIARSRNTGVITDGDGRWVNILPGLFLLTVRYVAYPMGEQTLYKQVYHAMRAKGLEHDLCVDSAVEAVEVWGNKRALSKSQLDTYLDEVHP